MQPGWTAAESDLFLLVQLAAEQLAKRGPLQHSCNTTFCTVHIILLKNEFFHEVHFLLNFKYTMYEILGYFILFQKYFPF
jgi:hypothetical protein